MDSKELIEIAGEGVAEVMRNFVGGPHELALQLFLSGFHAGVCKMTAETIGPLTVLKSRMQSKIPNT